MVIVPNRLKDKAASLRLVDFGWHLWLSCNIGNAWLMQKKGQG
jgi:hypothetical protein